MSVKSQKKAWIAGAIIVLGAGSYFIIRSRQHGPVVVAPAAGLTVPEGEAGKAGDLLISGEAMKLADIKIEPTISRTVSEKLNVTGSVQAGANELVKVTPTVSGKVVKILAAPGDTVHLGQTLALLESRDLALAQAAYRQASGKIVTAKKNLDRQRELAKLGQFGKPQVEEARTKSLEAERDVQKAEKDLAEERAKLKEIESEREGLTTKIAQAKAEQDVSKSRLDRAEALFKEELISKQELERIQADYKKASADVSVAVSNANQADARISGAKNRISSGEKEVRLAQRRASIVGQSTQREENVYKGQFLTNREIVESESTLRQAQVELQVASDAVRLLGGRPGSGNVISLTSPISGKVEERSATLGETIDPEHAAFTVVNLDKVWAQLAIAPKDISTVRIGDAVAITSETAPGRTFNGTILSIGTGADETTRTVNVRTTLGNAQGLLRPGVFVRGAIITDVRHERVSVPTGALQEHTGRPTIYVVKSGAPGGFEVRHVKLGLQGDGWREISEGLKPGERIAISGTFYLKSEALKSSLSDGCCAPGGG